MYSCLPGMVSHNSKCDVNVEEEVGLGWVSSTGDDPKSPYILKKHSLPLRYSPRSSYLAFTAQKTKLEEKILRGQNTRVAVLALLYELGRYNHVYLESSCSHQELGMMCFLPG